MTDEELIKQYRDQQAALNGGCSDGYCVIEKTTGMHTNGGCGCLYGLDFSGRHRVGVMLKNAQVMADRIEKFGEERTAIREAALREAAAVAEALAVKWWAEYKDRLSPHCADPQYQGMSDGADDVATAIEALIGEQK